MKKIVTGLLLTAMAVMGLGVGVAHAVVCPGDIPGNPPGVPDGMDSWGACWPGDTSTGPDPALTLTPYVGDITLDTPGQVLTGLDITGCVYVMPNAYAVQINHVKITCGADQAAGITVNMQSGSIADWAVISHVEISCNDEDGGTYVNSQFQTVRWFTTGIRGSGAKLDHVKIKTCERGIEATSNLRVNDSFVTTPHNSTDTAAVAMLPGYNVQLTHNALWWGTHNGTRSAAIQFQDAQCCVGGIGYAIFIDNNLLAGGYATLLLPYDIGKGQKKAYISVASNRWSVYYFNPYAGFFTPVRNRANTHDWTDNKYAHNAADVVEIV